MSVFLLQCVFIQHRIQEIDSRVEKTLWEEGVRSNLLFGRKDYTTFLSRDTTKDTAAEKKQK